MLAIEQAQFRYYDIIHLSKMPTRLAVSRLNHRALRSWLLVRSRAEDVTRLMLGYRKGKNKHTVNTPPTMPRANRSQGSCRACRESTAR